LKLRERPLAPTGSEGEKHTMSFAKTVYKSAWVIWIIGSLLIIASWISLVPLNWGWFGFVTTLVGVLLSMYSHWLARREKRSRSIRAHKIASVDDLEKVLGEATQFLDECAAAIRDLGLDAEKNVRRVGEAIFSVSEIRSEIYKRRPDLIPENFKTN
jgi:hypothetical protein